MIRNALRAAVILTLVVGYSELTPRGTAAEGLSCEEAWDFYGDLNSCDCSSQGCSNCVEFELDSFWCPTEDCEDVDFETMAADFCVDWCDWEHGECPHWEYMNPLFCKYICGCAAC